MQNGMEQTVTTACIPMADVLLKGEWGDPAYLVMTEYMTKEEHDMAVQKAIEDICLDFSQHNHMTVSLREVKRELVFEDTVYCNRRAMLVQFRVRDSY